MAGLDRDGDDLQMDEETFDLFRKDYALCEKCAKLFQDNTHKHKRCVDCRKMQMNIDKPRTDSYTEIISKPSNKIPKWTYGFMLLNINNEYEETE